MKIKYTIHPTKFTKIAMQFKNDDISKKFKCPRCNRELIPNKTGFRLIYEFSNKTKKCIYFICAKCGYEMVDSFIIEQFNKGNNQ